MTWNEDVKLGPPTPRKSAPICRGSREATHAYNPCCYLDLVVACTPMARQRVRALSRSNRHPNTKAPVKPAVLVRPQGKRRRKHYGALHPTRAAVTRNGRAAVLLPEVSSPASPAFSLAYSIRIAANPKCAPRSCQAEPGRYSLPEARMVASAVTQINLAEVQAPSVTAVA